MIAISAIAGLSAAAWSILTFRMDRRAPLAAFGFIALLLVIAAVGFTAPGIFVKAPYADTFTVRPLNLVLWLGVLIGLAAWTRRLLN